MKSIYKTQSMKYLVTQLFLTGLLLSGLTVNAQSTAGNAAQERMAKGNVAGAQVGSLICEDAQGQRVVCSGAMEETVLGLATSVPYVTINKPADPKASKFIFDALVSAAEGVVSKGDLLKAGKGGKLVLTDDAAQAYAVALNDVTGDGVIKVKLLTN